MRLDKFWLVTRPRASSELADICFQTDIKGLALQFKGGLDPEEIHAVYTSCNEAQREADRILTAFKSYEVAFEQGRRIARLEEGKS